MNRTVTRDLYNSLRSLALWVANSNDTLKSLSFATEPTTLQDAPSDVPLMVTSSSLIIYPSRSKQDYAVERMLTGSTLIKLSGKAISKMFKSSSDFRKLKKKEGLLYLDNIFREQLCEAGPNLVTKFDPKYETYRDEFPDTGLVVPLRDVLIDGIPIYDCQQETRVSGEVNLLNLFNADVYLLDSVVTEQATRYVFHMNKNMQVEVRVETIEPISAVYTIKDTHKLPVSYEDGFASISLNKAREIWK